MRSITLSHGALAYIDRGNGPIVLLVHGFPLDHSMWNSQIDSLAARARVIAPDLRGFGSSPIGIVDPVRGISMEQYAGELAELLDALGVGEPIVLIGLSMGGYIAWQFVRKFAARLRALVLCDTRALADTPEGRAGRLEMAENVAVWGSARVAEILGPKLLSARSLETQPELMAEIRHVISRQAPASIAAAQRGMACRPDVTSMLPDICVPTLVLVGELDAISTPAEMRAIADAIPRAEYVEIAAAGHMTSMENPAAVNDALLRFIAANSAS
jgi:pimeloyl-ACP methyl ester carboxylesterase